MKHVIFTLVLALTSLTSFAALEGKKFLFDYEGDTQYEVSFTEKTITWKGIKGVDQGRSETDRYQSMTAGKDSYFIQWTENDGSFVTVLIDLKQKSVFSSGVAGTFKWFRKGQLR